MSVSRRPGAVDEVATTASGPRDREPNQPRTSARWACVSLVPDHACLLNRSGPDEATGSGATHITPVNANRQAVYHSLARWRRQSASARSWETPDDYLMGKLVVRREVLLA